jgi:hypothetical protein
MKFPNYDGLMLGLPLTRVLWHVQHNESIWTCSPALFGHGARLYLDMEPYLEMSLALFFGNETRL